MQLIGCGRIKATARNLQLPAADAARGFLVQETVRSMGGDVQLDPGFDISAAVDNTSAPKFLGEHRVPHPARATRQGYGYRRAISSAEIARRQQTRTDREAVRARPDAETCVVVRVRCGSGSTTRGSRTHALAMTRSISSSGTSVRRPSLMAAMRPSLMS